MAKDGPSPLIRRAADYLKENYTRALELGGGVELHDALFLREHGLSVQVIDKETKVVDEAARLADAGIQVTNSAFEDIKEVQGTFDVIVAMYALHFCAPDSFARLLPLLQDSLNVDGLFCCTFLGKNDGWADRPEMNFQSTQEVRDLFKNYSILYFSEAEWEGVTRKGTPKHWHVYSVIARKNS